MDKILIIYTVINVFTFLAFGLDKLKARKDRWRIPEKSLLLMGLCFGGLGQLAGMKIFRHKTKKWYFQVTAYLFTVIQIGVLIYFYTKSIA